MSESSSNAPPSQRTAVWVYIFVLVARGRAKQEYRFHSVVFITVSLSVFRAAVWDHLNEIACGHGQDGQLNDTDEWTLRLSDGLEARTFPSTPSRYAVVQHVIVA
ncbi:hypothetical protein B0H13DRAFT_2326112 [Mycena leptocephala]|nr:hypothetical protein B0H13DRAFT_2326112 [Mycena leptocephala]